jgi:DNA-binding MarR family transcriptional regulator
MTDDASPRSEDVVEVATRLHSDAIHLLRRQAREDAALGVSGARLSVLSVLVFGGTMPLGRLAQAERVTPPSMTRLVAAMEREGLVSREADPDDARVARISATDQGRRLLLAGRDRRVTALADGLTTLDADALATVGRATEVIEQLLRDERHRHGARADDAGSAGRG